jgi:hypothetical protein
MTCPHGLPAGCSECDADPLQSLSAQSREVSAALADLPAHRSLCAMLRRDVPRLAGMIPPEAEAIISWARIYFLKKGHL